MDKEDDYFGIKQLHTVTTPTPVPLSRTIGNDRKTKRVGKTVDQPPFFDTHFFPGYAEPGESKDRSTTTVDDYFTEQFFNKMRANGLEEADRPESEEHEEESTAGDDTTEEKKVEGLKTLREQMDSVWKLTKGELIDLMSTRVIYQTDDLIAFDKPYSLAYSGSNKKEIHMDSLLQGLKKIVAPEADRLHLILPLDKACSGIILFAKNQQKQEQMRDFIKKDLALLRFRCLVRGIPEEERVRVAIPLIKVLKEGDFKLCPLKEEAKSNRKLYHINTDCQLVNTNAAASVSLIDAFITQGIAHVVRSHLYYGLNCAIVGEKKYLKDYPTGHPLKKQYQGFQNLSPGFLERLNLKKNSIRDLPFYMHLNELHVPESAGGKFSIVRAELPSFFKYTLKKLKMLSK